MKRARARRERQQAEIDRASAETERGLLIGLPDPSKPIERAEALGTQTRAAIEAFAATEDEIARIHEELAATRVGRGEYRRTAEKHARPAKRCAHSPADTGKGQPFN